MLNLVVATSAEAEPIISILKLKRVTDTLSYYRTSDGQKNNGQKSDGQNSDEQNRDIHLIVTGMGKSNVATACGWLAHKTLPTQSIGRTSAAWLNLGIAGHKTAAVGTPFLAHKITDLATEKVWFPHRLSSSTASADLITVDKPLNTYQPETLHDMEASAYVEAARRFSDAELVQSLKVVSDNEDNPWTTVNARLATKVISNNLETIVDCIDTLQKLSKTITTPNDTISISIQEQWRFSVSQVVQLERFLQRYRVMHSQMTEIPEGLQNKKSSKDVLSWFKQTLDGTEIDL